MFDFKKIEMFSNIQAKLVVAEVVLKTLRIDYKIVTPKNQEQKG